MKGFGATTYLIARRRPVSLHDWNQPFITYTPPAAPDDRVSIGSYDNHTPHSAGGECSPQHFLDRPTLVQMLKDLGGAWFLPFLERLAAGETVPLPDISAAYQQQNGIPLEAKSSGSSFFPCEQFGYDWAQANPPLQLSLTRVISGAAGIANADWDGWQRGTARQIHRYIENHYLAGKPPPPETSLDFFHRGLVLDCAHAARAAEREKIFTRAEKLAALNASSVRAPGKESYGSLFAAVLGANRH